MASMAAARPYGLLLHGTIAVICGTLLTQILLMFYTNSLLSLYLCIAFLKSGHDSVLLPAC